VFYIYALKYLSDEKFLCDGNVTHNDLKNGFVLVELSTTVTLLFVEIDVERKILLEEVTKIYF